MREPWMILMAALLLVGSALGADNVPPEGFITLFNGKDLSGWKGLVGNPLARAKMSAEKLKAEQKKADEQMAKHWRVADGQIINDDGRGPHLCTDNSYRDFELWVDWKIAPGADSGIYLRSSPQVQIWDPVGGIPAAKVGSGGLYNNKVHPSAPLIKADKPAGEWNTFYIRMIGERVTVNLNGQLVVDNVVLENYWDRSRPIFASGPIELQTHNGAIHFKNIYIRAIPAEEVNAILSKENDTGFREAFNGKDLAGWFNATSDYEVKDGAIVCKTGRGGTLFMREEYGDFALRFEFKLPPGGNNGIAIRAPEKGNPAYLGMEIQVLDDSAPKHANLRPAQYHGSIYDLVPARRGYQRPVGEWNYEEIVARGSRITVALNGTTIVDADLARIPRDAHTAKHPGLDRTKGYIGLFGHNDPVAFRNIRIRDDHGR